MNIKVKNLVRRVAKGKLKKARFYAAFRVSQSPNLIRNERRVTNFDRQKKALKETKNP